MKSLDDIIERNELPDVNFQGIDGNAFALMAHWRKGARKAGWNRDDITAVLNRAKSSDYDHLLQTLLKFSQ